jgi:V-type H+-transporting ATPase subunit C
MSAAEYILLSLPLRIFEDDPISSLTATVGRDNGEVLPFAIPSFKIGTLDALVQHADDLTKLNALCESVVSKVADSLKAILDGDEHKAAQHKMVNDSTSTP